MSGETVNRRSKNIVLCSDGTGNLGGKGNGTNVWRLYNSVDIHGHKENPQLKQQLSFYDDGIGTEDFKLWKILGGAFGWGLSRNIRQLYEFIVKNYAPGDDIYLFGFSRGAFTVRSLAGLITKCGILDRQKMANGKPKYGSSSDVKKGVKEAYKAYRRDHWRKSNILVRFLRRFGIGRNIQAAATFRRENSLPDSKIKCIGVWDTVDAIGVPFDGLRWVLDKIFCIRFHSHDLSKDVEFGFHAMSIDDERHTFHPVLWNEHQGEHSGIEQVWFPGVHSNVGGGYPKQGMAHVSLYWMMAKATEHGLRFYEGAMDKTRSGANVHDKLYDSRAGFASYYRYRPRQIEILGKKNCKGPARIHVSAFERILQSTQNYAPGNLPSDFDIDISGSPGVAPEFLGEMQTTFKEIIRKENERIGVKGKSLSSRTAKHIAWRIGLFWLFVTYTVVAIGWIVIFLKNSQAPLQVSGFGQLIGKIWSSVASLAPGFAKGYVQPAGYYFQQHPFCFVFLALFLLLVLFANGAIRNRMKFLCDNYWSRVREEFKRAEEQVG